MDSANTEGAPDFMSRLGDEPIRSMMNSEPLVVAPNATIRLLLGSMAERKASCALVVDGEALVGLFTERDYLDRIAGQPELLDEPVSKFMSSDPHTLGPDATLASLLPVIVDHGFRHLPVVEAGKPVGLVAALDIVKYIADLFPTEVYNLPPQLDQVLPRVEGA